MFRIKNNSSKKKAKKEQELNEISTIFQTFLENVQGIFKKEPSNDEIVDRDLSKKLIETNNEDTTEQNLKESLFNKCW